MDSSALVCDFRSLGTVVIPVGIGCGENLEPRAVNLLSKLRRRRLAIQLQLVKLQAEIKVVESNILRLAPKAPLERPIHKPHPLFPRGEISRCVLNALRESPSPMTMREITDQILALKSPSLVGEEMRQHTRERVSTVLAVLRSQGRVQKLGTWNKWKWAI